MFLDYSGVRVTNLERSLAFYTGILGLREIGRGTMFHGGVYVLLEDPASKQRLELNWYPPGNDFAVPFSVGEGLDHIGFRVADVQGAVEKLTQAGATLALEPFVYEGVMELAFLRDPDGLWIELGLIHTEGA